MRFQLASIAIAASLFASVAFGQGMTKAMVISTGSPTGAYNPMGNDLVNICQIGGSTGVVESGGSIDNHNNIWEKQPATASAGIFQYDFALYMRDRDPRWQQSMQVVARLHDEYLQIIALNQELKEGGWTIPGIGKTIGGSIVVLQSFDSLKGRTVYAWGGSFYSANVLSDKFGLGLQVVDLSGTAPDGKGGYVKVIKDQKPEPEKVAAMLIAQGKGVAVIAVGAANLSWVNEANGYGKQWKLLPVSNDQHAKVAGTYGIGKVSYLNLSGGQVQTLTVPALLMTRKYTTDARVAPIVAVQNCIQTKIDALRDEGNNKSKWAEVDPKKALAFDGWPMFQVPAGLAVVPASVSAPPPAKPAKK
jgi:TRAP-type uncharacterized transport system substrate-binding protein